VKHLLSIFLFSFLLFANSNYNQNIVALAQKLHLYPGEKATIQWNRVFSSPRHLKRYKLDTLDETTKQKLKAYLVSHAADSEQPTLPGL